RPRSPGPVRPTRHLPRSPAATSRTRLRPPAPPRHHLPPAVRLHLPRPVTLFRVAAATPAAVAVFIRAEAARVAVAAILAAAGPTTRIRSEGPIRLTDRPFPS